MRTRLTDIKQLSAYLWRAWFKLSFTGRWNCILYISLMTTSYSNCPSLLWSYPSGLGKAKGRYFLFFILLFLDRFPFWLRWRTVFLSWHIASSNVCWVTRRWNPPGHVHQTRCRVSFSISLFSLSFSNSLFSLICYGYGYFEGKIKQNNEYDIS